MVGGVIMQKIRNKILVAIVGCVIVVSIITNAISIVKSSMDIKKEAEEKIQALTINNENELSNLIVKTQTLASSLNSSVETSVNITNTGKAQDDLNHIVLHVLENGIRGNKDIVLAAYVIIGNKSTGDPGDLLYEDIFGDRYSYNITVNSNEKYKDNDKIYSKLYSQVRSKDTSAWSDIESKDYEKEIPSEANKKVITYANPIYINNKFVGMVGVELDFNKIQDLIRKIKVNDTGYAFLLDGDLNYMVHKTLKNTDNLRTYSNGKYNYMADLFKRNKSGVTETEFMGSKKIIGYTTVSNGWILALSVPESEVVSGETKVIYFNTLVIFIGILISIYLAQRVSKRLSTPIVEATIFAEQIAMGNLEGNLTIDSKDETATLAKALNRAATNIKKLIEQLRQKEERLVEQVSELKKSQSTISKLAYSNYITKIANRNCLNLELPEILLEFGKCNRKATMFYLDIDNFNVINDILGHNKGDEIIREIGMELKKSVQGEEKIYHTGADEFVLFIPDLVETEEVKKYAEKICKDFKNYLVKDDTQAFHLTISMGIASFPKHGRDVIEIFRNADTVLGTVKRSGKNNYKIFSADMLEKMLEKKNLENQLRYAINNKELEIHYQPKIDSKTQKIIAMEALLRWNNPILGKVSPDKFIPLAEETGLILNIGEYVLRESCLQNKLWQDKGIEPVRVAVNFSAKQLQQENIVDIIKNILEDTGLEAKWLEIEITESMFMTNFQESKEVLVKIQALGINIYLDDFGTGYSSLNYLRQLPINYIKIDKSFVNELTTNFKDGFIASSLIQLAHGIDLKVVAEGVETKHQYEILKQYGCDEIQGYYFSRPVDSHAFEELLRANYKEEDV